MPRPGPTTLCTGPHHPYTVTIPPLNKEHAELDSTGLGTQNPRHPFSYNAATPPIVSWTQKPKQRSRHEHGPDVLYVYHGMLSRKLLTYVVSIDMYCNTQQTFHCRTLPMLGSAPEHSQLVRILY